MKKIITTIFAVLFLASCSYPNGNLPNDTFSEETQTNLYTSPTLDTSEPEIETQTNEYISLVTDTITDGIITSMDVDYWLRISFYKDNISDKTIVFDSIEYTGVYKKSVTNRMNSYVTDEYKSKDGVEFEIRSDTNELVGIFFRSSKDFRLTEISKPEKELTYEMLIATATSIASRCVDDISDYSLIVGEVETYFYTVMGTEHEMLCYPITYVRKINGYPTSDYITIRITDKGSLASIICGDIYAFKNVSVNFDETAVTKSISDKLDSIYEEYQVKSFSFNDQRIVCTPNKEIGILSDISVKLYNDSDGELDTIVVLLTVVDDISPVSMGE